MYFVFISILKMFMPGWRFFNDVGPNISVRVRIDDQWVDYVALGARRKQNVAKLIVNPQSNFHLYFMSRIERTLRKWNEKENLQEFIKREFQEIQEFILEDTNFKAKNIDFVLIDQGQEHKVSLL